MMWWSVVVLCACACVTAVTQEESEARLVKTAQGPVRGYKAPEDDLFIFYGIPYATAPTGSEKFKAPLPAPVWFQPFEAIDNGIICPQGHLKFFDVSTKTMQENCLIANVYVPDTDETNLPVVVYIHGGAFQIGYGDLLTPKNFVKSKKVIAVTFNYRLGVHGFLCLGTEDAPGNAGMKDQVALLRWVKKNIASFGGNPDNVTIAGYSAGSSSVDLLVVSRYAKGLFHKAIPESGANLGPATVLDPLENAKIYAMKLNFTNVEDIYALEEFYKTASYESLTLFASMDNTDSTLHFSPCVERDIGLETFLVEAPKNVMKTGKFNKVPMLYGFSNMEGLFRVPYFTYWKDKMNEKFSDFLPGDLQFESEDQKEEVAEKVKKFYFRDEAVSEENILEYVDYFTDVLFGYPMLNALRLYAEAGHEEIYLYEYSFTDEETPLVPFTKVRGADHCAQTGAVLDGMVAMSADEAHITEDFKKMKTVMRELWLNFITTGKPVPAGSSLPAWPAANADRSPHMSLAAPLQLRGPLLEERARFWDGIYERHYRTPMPPPTPPPKPHSEL